MPLVLLDLSEAKKATRPQRTRTMTPQNMLAILGGTGAGGFAAAKMGRTTADWPTLRRSPDQELLFDLPRLRARARERSINSPIAAKFLQMVRTNVVGAHGIKVEFKVELQRKREGSDIYDDETNTKLSRAWKKWCRKEYCTVHGKLSFQDVLNLWADAIGRDGDFLLRKVNLVKADNPFGFALQLLDADQLNDYKNIIGSAQGPQIRMGVEVDQYQKPQAYWLYDGNPFESGMGNANCKRVPAEQIIHSYIPRRIGQSRGYPLAAPVLYDMNQLDKYFDAELVAARSGAQMFATIEQEKGSDEFEGDGENTDGTVQLQLANGTIPVLGIGQKLANHTPEHPTTAFNPFVERSLRLIAAGLGVPYHELGNDYASVNFSSGRLGRQEAIDYWMELQRKLIQDVVDPIVQAFVRSALLTGAIDLPFTPDRYLDADVLHYIPRRWDYVDPLKDVQSDIDSIQNGLETHETVLMKRGKDWQKVFKQLKAEQDFADDLGLQLGTDIRGDALSEVNDGAPPAEDGAGATPPAKPAAKKPAKPGKKAQAESERRMRRAALLTSDE
jgi:lambda family phage portal protein